ncbi:MAG: indolepyruvate ferredoxin oxidoreductase, partial [Anaerolineae bacterium]|nr:indolepyruvate ferredoxin oxidoreductase [Anaerolineae bacterium]
MAERLLLLGDEAVALAAVHAGMSGAYSYPGTPASEIFEYVERLADRFGVHSDWSANEKVAYEEALGMSFAGKRVLVSMKHVGLNVAADPFVNSAISGANGGLVLAVADDPGMHSSQNEQDSRYYANFARIPCLEPANQQEAYEMTREAFELSERFGLPVMVRLTTRLAHSRADVAVGEPREQKGLKKPSDVSAWTLLPGNARRQYRKLLEKQPDLLEASESSQHNMVDLSGLDRSLGVIASGIAYNYFMEAVGGVNPYPYVKIGMYPLPVSAIRRLYEAVDRMMVIEEGYPFIEEL